MLPDEQAFQNIDHFHLEFRVRDFLIDSQEDIQDIALVFHMVHIDLSRKNPQQDDKLRPLRHIRFRRYLLLIVLLSEDQSFRLDQIDIYL